MKNLNFAVILLLILFTKNSNSQNIKDYSSLEKAPSFYIGVGTGLNYNCGLLGLKLTGRLSDKILVDASVGNGTWGKKLGLGLIFNAKNENAWCPVISVSRATGIDNLPLEVKVTNGSGVTNTATYNINYHAATMINLGVQKQWIRPKGNRITLELGYSVLVSGGEYSVSDKGLGLTIADSMKPVFELLKPGGLTIGFGYYFALN